MKYLKYTLYGFLALLFFSQFLVSCDASGGYEEVEIPTAGLITTVAELGTNDWKIEDEVAVADTSDSRIIAKYLTGEIDTFTLEQARLVERMGYDNVNNGGMFRAASYGFMGYMLGRSMSGFRPSATAYRDPNTYNRVNGQAGQQVRSSAVKTSRPKAGKSGFGSSRSTRSYGG